MYPYNQKQQVQQPQQPSKPSKPKAPSEVSATDQVQAIGKHVWQGSVGSSQQMQKLKREDSGVDIIRARTETQGNLKKDAESLSQPPSENKQSIQNYMIKGSSFGQRRESNGDTNSRKQKRTNQSGANNLMVSEISIVNPPVNPALNESGSSTNQLRDIKKIFQEFDQIEQQTMNNQRREVSQGTQKIDCRSFNMDDGTPEKIEGTKLENERIVLATTTHHEKQPSGFDDPVSSQGRNTITNIVKSMKSVTNPIDGEDSANNSGSFIGGGGVLGASFEPNLNYSVIPAIHQPMAPVLHRPQPPEENYISVTNINQQTSHQKCNTDHSKSSPGSRSKSIKGNKGVSLINKRAAKDRNISTHMTQDFNQFAIDDSDLGNTTDGKLVSANNTTTHQAYMQKGSTPNPILDVEIKHSVKGSAPNEGSGSVGPSLDKHKSSDKGGSHDYIPTELRQSGNYSKLSSNADLIREQNNMSKTSQQRRSKKGMNYNNLELKNLLNLKEISEAEKAELLRVGGPFTNMLDLQRMSQEMADQKLKGERISSKLNLYKHEIAQAIPKAKMERAPSQKLLRHSEGFKADSNSLADRIETGSVAQNSQGWAVQTHHPGGPKPAFSAMQMTDKQKTDSHGGDDEFASPYMFGPPQGQSMDDFEATNPDQLNRRWMNKFFTKRQNLSSARRKPFAAKKPKMAGQYSQMKLPVQSSGSYLAQSHSLAGVHSSMTRKMDAKTAHYFPNKEMQSTFTMDQQSQSTKMKSQSSAVPIYQVQTPTRTHSNLLLDHQTPNLNIVGTYKASQEGWSGFNQSNPYFEGINLQNSSNGTLNSLEISKISQAHQRKHVEFQQSSLKQKKTIPKKNRKGSQTPQTTKQKPSSLSKRPYGQSSTKYIQHYHALNQSKMLTFVDTATSSKRLRNILPSGSKPGSQLSIMKQPLNKAKSEMRISKHRIDEVTQEQTEEHPYQMSNAEASPPPKKTPIIQSEFLVRSPTASKMQENNDYGILNHQGTISPLKKKMTVYQKREEEFQKVYEQKLAELRHNYVKAQTSSYMTMTSESRVHSTLVTPRLSSNRERGTGTGQLEDKPRLKKRVVVKDEQKLLPRKPVQFQKTNTAMRELNIYPEDFHRQHHKLISNRIKILARIQRDPRGFYYGAELGTQTKRFFHKDQMLTQETFDPLRLKIRVMPITRAPKNQGKTPDFYFMEASKLSLRNNLTQAIESLHKGLNINPYHLYCRFTHGVLMFKLGLLSQAKLDFQLLFEKNPKELLLHYNFALTLLQLGEYQKAISVIDHMIKQSQDTKHFGGSQKKSTSSTPQQSSRKKISDSKLLYDANMLKAQCLWRNGDPLEAVKSFNVANRFKEKYWKKANMGRLSFEQLLIQLQDCIYREYKYDIAESYSFYMAHVSRSPRPPRLDDPRSMMRQSLKIQKITSAEAFASKRQTVKFTDHLLLDGEFDLEQEKASLGLKQFLSNIRQKERMRRIKSAREKVSESQSSRRDRILSQERELPGYDEFLQEQQAPPAIHSGVASEVLVRQGTNFNSAASSQYHGTDMNLKSLESIRKLKSIMSKKKGDEASKLPDSAKAKLHKLKTSLVNMKENTKQVRQMLFDKRADKFYQELREKQIEIIDQGNTLRFDQVYGHMIKHPTERAKKKSDHDPRGRQDTSITFNKPLPSEGSEATQEELKQINMMQKLSEEHERQQKAMSSEALSQSRKKSTQKFTEFMMKSETKAGDQIQNREIGGTDFHLMGINVINQQQAELEVMSIQLRDKFNEVDAAWQKEMDREERRIYNPCLADEDVSEFLQGDAQQTDKKKEKGEALRKKANPIIEQLKACLKKTNVIPDDVCNILTTDLEEKKKMREIKSQKLTQKTKRLNNRRLTLIREEFSLRQGAHRSVKILDLMLQSLKFFVRFSEHQRRLIFEQAEHITLPARTVIFRQGDQGNQMYVIIKGRVAVEKKSIEIGNLPIVKALLTDGDHFGELSLIDQEKVDRHTKESDLVDADQLFQEKLKYDRRKASCITVEETDLLIIHSKLSQLLYQPDKKKQTKNLQGQQVPAGVPPGGANANANIGSTSEASSKERDELSKKISVLQSQHIFDDIDPRYLIPIACNMETRTYSYGEFLIKKGEIPKGLFILTSGQCKVVAKRIGSRQLITSQKDGGHSEKRTNMKHLHLQDNLLYNFNPETSVLNQVNALQPPSKDGADFKQTAYRELGFQNARVLLDEFGNEVRDRIDYADYMVFSQLTKGNSFGSRVLVPFDLYQKNKRLFFGDSVFERFYPFHLGNNTALGNTEKMTNAQIKALIDKEPEENYQLKSLLSVVADSAQVQVYVIDKSFMSYLPDKILNQICEKVICLKEVDRPYYEQDILFIIEQFQKWDQFKIGCVEKLFERKRLEKFMMGATK